MSNESMGIGDSSGSPLRERSKQSPSACLHRRRQVRDGRHPRFENEGGRIGRHSMPSQRGAVVLVTCYAAPGPQPFGRALRPARAQRSTLSPQTRIIDFIGDHLGRIISRIFGRTFLLRKMAYVPCFFLISFTCVFTPQSGESPTFSLTATSCEREDDALGHCLYALFDFHYLPLIVDIGIFSGSRPNTQRTHIGRRGYTECGRMAASCLYT